MKHAFWDKYSYLDSPIHRFSPNLKLLFTLFSIIIFTLLPFGLLLYLAAGYGIFMSVTIYVSRVPVNFLLRRVLVILPFIIPLILLNLFFRDGNKIEVSILISVRSILSILLLLVLVSTTRFDRIIKTLEKWRIPAVLLTILSFMYRYIFLLVDEIEKMARSVRLRSAHKHKYLIFRSYISMAGMLFIKSFDRAERVFQAMEMRGYSGNWKSEIK